MTHNTQGGIARREKALEILNKNIGAEVLGTFGETDTQWIIDAMIEFKELDESPLPASPEGTWETEFEKLYAKKNYYNLVSFVQSIFQPIQQENNGYKEWHEDVQRICREIDVTLFGEEGASKQPSLCDIQKSVERLKSQLAEAMEANGQLEKHYQASQQSLKSATEIGNKLVACLEEVKTFYSEDHPVSKMISSALNNNVK